MEVQQKNKEIITSLVGDGMFENGEILRKILFNTINLKDRTVIQITDDVTSCARRLSGEGLSLYLAYFWIDKTDAKYIQETKRTMFKEERNNMKNVKAYTTAGEHESALLKTSELQQDHVLIVYIIGYDAEDKKRNRSDGFVGTMKPNVSNIHNQVKIRETIRNNVVPLFLIEPNFSKALQPLVDRIRTEKETNDLVTVKESTIKDAGKGVFAKEVLKAGTKLGFYGGPNAVFYESESKINDRNTLYTTQVSKTVGGTEEHDFYICAKHGMMNVSDGVHWTGRINNGIPGHRNSTVSPYGKVEVTKQIEKDEELFYSYGIRYWTHVIFDRDFDKENDETKKFLSDYIKQYYDVDESEYDGKLNTQEKKKKNKNITVVHLDPRVETPKPQSMVAFDKLWKPGGSVTVPFEPTCGTLYKIWRVIKKVCPLNEKDILLNFGTQRGKIICSKLIFSCFPNMKTICFQTDTESFESVKNNIRFLKIPNMTVRNSIVKTRTKLNALYELKCGIVVAQQYNNDDDDEKSSDKSDSESITNIRAIFSIRDFSNISYSDILLEGIWNMYILKDLRFGKKQQNGYLYVKQPASSV